MMSYAEFKTATAISRRRRNKIKSIDRIMTAFAGNEAPSAQDQLDYADQIVDACHTYVARQNRQNSGRCPGVRTLLVEACQDLLVWAAARNDQARAQKAYNRYQAAPGPNPSLFLGRDENGFGPVGANATHNSDPAMINMLIGFGADPNELRDPTANSNWPTNWTPLDIARANVSPSSETALQTQNATSVSPTRLGIQSRAGGGGFAARRLRRADSLTSLGRGPARVHTVDVLMAATCNDADNARNIRDAYDNLYSIEFLRPILGLAALQAIGNRTVAAAAARALRIFTAGGQSAPAGGDGIYNAFNNTLVVGAKGSASPRAIDGQKSMEGTLVHELTHHAALVAFDNDVMPFPRVVAVPLPAGTGRVEPAYLNAIHADLQLADNQTKGQNPTYAPLRTANDIDATDAPGGIFVTVLGRCPVGYAMTGGFVATAPFQCSLGMAFEYIVGIPQSLALYGRGPVNTQTPNLLAYFEQTFIPRIEAFVAAHAHFGSLAPPPLTNVGLAAHVPAVPAPAAAPRGRAASFDG